MREQTQYNSAQLRSDSATSDTKVTRDVCERDLESISHHICIHVSSPLLCQQFAMRHTMTGSTQRTLQLRAQWVCLKQMPSQHSQRRSALQLYDALHTLLSTTSSPHRSYVPTAGSVGCWASPVNNSSRCMLGVLCVLGSWHPGQRALDSAAPGAC